MLADRLSETAPPDVPGHGAVRLESRIAKVCGSVCAPMVSILLVAVSVHWLRGSLALAGIFCTCAWASARASVGALEFSRALFRQWQHSQQVNNSASLCVSCH